MEKSVIYEPMIQEYLVNKLSPTLTKVTMWDTNIWSSVVNTIEKDPHNGKKVLEYMLKDDPCVVLPSIILAECVGNCTQQQFKEKFEKKYIATFQIVNEICPIHIVSIKEMENLLVSSSANGKEAFTKALLLAKELFKIQPNIYNKLRSADTFAAIEKAILSEPKDAGERIILLYTMLFINEYVEVDILTNEVAVYTDRQTYIYQTQLQALLYDISLEAFLKAFQVKSFDCILLELFRANKDLFEQGTTFLKYVRQSRNRFIRIIDTTTNYSDKVNCGDNTEFLQMCQDWFEMDIQITF